MIEEYAGLVASLEAAIKQRLDAGVLYFYSQYPAILSPEDLDALKLYGELLRHHRHDKFALFANMANLLVWLPLLTANPMNKPAEVTLFGKYDTNLSVTEFMRLAEDKLGSPRSGVELHQLVTTMLWWDGLVTRWLWGTVLVQQELAAGEEEE